MVVGGASRVVESIEINGNYNNYSDVVYPGWHAILEAGLGSQHGKFESCMKLNLHEAMEHGISSKINPFLWFHMLQHPTVIISMKNGSWYLSLASIIMSWMLMSVFHSIPIFHQKFWLKVHEKRRWVLSSMSSSLHKIQEVESKWNDFLVSNSHVLILSLSASQAKIFVSR